ncbi:inositol 2-dehydrogenase [Aestuariibius sp. 2305UL40-4]|uniref:inositol 2-dehydrogenase n=1 Tax=Aestuariibius violaceus TaxID=3234132 RepID=UPI00345E2577
MIRLGLLGCDRIGQVHAGSLSRIGEAQLVAVADAVPEAAKTLASRHSAQVRDSEAILSDADIDAVIIATPTSLHFDQIHAAAISGKAIFCEKPIDLSSERASICAEAVAEAGVTFFTGFNRRFDPSFAYLEAQIRTGVIGEVEMIVITSRDPNPPPISYVETSGGLFRDMMIHDFDMARFLLGEEPAELFATGSCLVDPAIGAAGDIDTAAVTLQTAKGKLCQINNSRRATYGYDQRIEVHGAGGMLRAGNHPEHFVERAGTGGFTHAPNMHFFLERYEAAYLLEMRAFLDAIRKGIKPSPGIEDGVAAQRLADAAARSHALGMPLKLSR